MLKGGGALNPDGLALDLAFALDRSFTTDPAAAGNALITSRRGPTAKFSRGSGATQVNAAGLIEYAPENLSLYSGALVHAVGWNAANVTSTPDGLSHDGGVAYQVSEAATSSDHTFVNTGGTTVANATSVSGGIIYTASIFLKKVIGSIDWIQVTIGSAGFGPAQFANFNIESGIAGNYAGLASGTLPVIESYGNGWYRCSISVVGIATVTNSAGTVFAFINNINGTTRLPSYLGSTTNSVLAYGAQIERASTARTYYPTTTAAFYGPRFDYDPATGASKGLLIEESRSNIYLRSDNFADSNWTKTRLSIQTDAIIAPDGAMTADKLIEDTTVSNTHTIGSNVTPPATPHTLSVFAKKGERDFIVLRLGGTNDFFNLNTGVATTNNNSPKITNFGNGWYRCTVTSSAGTQGSFQLSADGITSSYTGDGTSGIYLWGAQLEAGAFPTSYIPTTIGTAARSADVCSIEGTDFSSFYNQPEGSVVINGDSWNGTAPAWCGFNVGPIGSGRTFEFVRSGLNLIHADSFAGNTVVKSSPTFPNKFGFVRGQANGSSSFGGVAGGSTGTAQLAAPNRLQIGLGASPGAGYLNGCIKSLTYYRKQLSTIKLQTLTAP